MPVNTRRSSKIPIIPTVRQQKVAKADAERRKKMAEELKALQRRCEFISAKVARIKTNLIKADDEQTPVNEYVLDTFLRTIDAAYIDMNDWRFCCHTEQTGGRGGKVFAVRRAVYGSAGGSMQASSRAQETSGIPHRFWSPAGTKCATDTSSTVRFTAYAATNVRRQLRALVQV